MRTNYVNRAYTIIIYFVYRASARATEEGGERRVFRDRLPKWKGLNRDRGESIFV